MHRRCSRRSRARQARWGLVLGCLTLGGLLGCEEGQPPYEVIPGSDPSDFLPPDGVVPGTTRDLGVLYYFDTTQYRLVDPVPGTASRFIKRDKVLVLVNATQEQQRNPDASDATLRDVYANPRLFGFVPAVGRQPGFEEGPVLPGTADEYWPLDTSAGVSTWDYNHDQFLWTRRDSLVGPETSPTGPAWRLRWTNVVRLDRRTTYLPSGYELDILVSSSPTEGIFLHGFHLVAERREVLGPNEFRRPETQRNPHFAWLAEAALGTSDTNANIPTTVDQCIDGMWGSLDFFPIQLADADLQVGERFTTWTYVSVDTAELRRRITGAGTALEELRCSGSGIDTEELGILNPNFPTAAFTLLARYEVSIEDAFDAWVQRGGEAGANAVVGIYGTQNDGVLDVVKLVIRMYAGAPADHLVQRIDLLLLRGVGPVVQLSGIRAASRSTTRLRQATVNGRVFTESDFSYLP